MAIVSGDLLLYSLNNSRKSPTRRFSGILTTKSMDRKQKNSVLRHPLIVIGVPFCVVIALQTILEIIDRGYYVCNSGINIPCWLQRIYFILTWSLILSAVFFIILVIVYKRKNKGR